MEEYEFNGEWDFFGEKWWTWNWIHNVKRLDITFAELEKLVEDGKVKRMIFNNPNSPGGNKKTLGYLVKDIKKLHLKKRPKRKTKQQEIDEALDEIDRRSRGYYDR